MSSTLCPGVAASDRLANSNALPYGGVKKFHTNGKDSLRSLFPNLAKPENFHPYEYDELIENIGRSSGEAQELLTVRADQMIPFGVIYIHTSPCQFACQTAVDIADALKSKLIDAVVRIDDRISSSCFTSTADRIIVLQSILSHLHTLEPYGSSGWNCLDRIWLDQRLYSLESDPAASGDLLGTSNLIDVFSQEKFQDYQRPFAGVIIVGEVDVCGPLLQAEPFPRMPRPPRECEVYEITCTVGGYNRKYISKFVARPVPPKETQGQPGVDTRSSNLHLGKRPASPLASGSGKRQLTTSEKSDRRSQGSSSSSS